MRSVCSELCLLTFDLEGNSLFAAVMWSLDNSDAQQSGEWMIQSVSTIDASQLDLSASKALGLRPTATPAATNRLTGSIAHAKMSTALSSAICPQQSAEHTLVSSTKPS